MEGLEVLSTYAYAFEDGRYTAVGKIVSVYEFESFEHGEKMSTTRIEAGMKAGYLTCLKKIGGGGGSIWLCRCVCGYELPVSEAMLVSGVMRSCGCKKNRIINLYGRQYGRLTVLDPVPGRGTDGSVLWLCRCECGNYKVYSSNKLRTGHTTNCGCAIGEAEREAKTFIDGTCVEIMLSGKVPKTNTSGYRGVARKRNKWQAYINYGGRRRHLGSYDTKEEAAQARRLAEEKIRQHLHQLINSTEVKKAEPEMRRISFSQ